MNRYEITLQVETKSIRSRHRTSDVAADCGHGSWDDAGKHATSGANELRRLVGTLRALGLESSVVPSGSSSILTIRYPSPADAARMAKRGGRRRVPLPYDSPLRELAASEAVAWLDEHTEAEREKAFGVSRASCYRRMRELREIAERNPGTRFWDMVDKRHR